MRTGGAAGDGSEHRQPTPECGPEQASVGRPGANQKPVDFI